MQRNISLVMLLEADNAMRYPLPEALNSFPVPMIPLQDQERIGEILSALDKKIELNRRINQKLPTLDRSLKVVIVRLAA